MTDKAIGGLIVIGVAALVLTRRQSAAAYVDLNAGLQTPPPPSPLHPYSPGITASVPPPVLQQQEPTPSNDCRCVQVQCFRAPCPPLCTCRDTSAIGGGILYAGGTPWFDESAGSYVDVQA